MRAVNLLPADASQRKSLRKEDPAVVVGSALGAVVLVALIAGFLNVHSKVNADQKQLTPERGSAHESRGGQNNQRRQRE